MEDHIRYMGAFDVEFNDSEDARKVHDLMQSGMKFQEAVDHLELRPNMHYTVTRTDAGPDGLKVC